MTVSLVWVSYYLLSDSYLLETVTFLFYAGDYLVVLNIFIAVTLMI